MTTTGSSTDSVGRPLQGPDGAYSQTPDQIRAEYARLADMVARGVYPESMLRAYSPYLYAEQNAR